MASVVCAFIYSNSIILVVGQGPLGRFTESQSYHGEVYKHQPQHTRIVQLAVEPAVSSGMTNPAGLQQVVYFSNDINNQFYLHSRTGNVMVDAMELIEGNYTFTAYANYTAIVGLTVTMESLSVMVIVRVLPEFYFVGIEQDGSYLAYVSTDAPTGTHVTRIIPQFTLLNETIFSYYAIDGVESSSLPVNLTATGSLELIGSSNTSEVLQFVVVSLAIDSSSVVVETLRVLVTIVFYQLSGMHQLSDDSDHILQIFVVSHFSNRFTTI